MHRERGSSRLARAETDTQSPFCHYAAAFGDRCESDGFVLEPSFCILTAANCTFSFVVLAERVFQRPLRPLIEYYLHRRYFQFILVPGSLFAQE